MPYKIEWLVDQRIVLSTFSGVVTLDDLQQWLPQQMEMVESGTPLVHHISNGLAVERVEMKIKTLQMLVRAIKPHPNFGWHIEVTANPLNRMLGGLATQFAGVRVRLYDSMEQSLLFLKANDETLAPLLEDVRLP